MHFSRLLISFLFLLVSCSGGGSDDGKNASQGGRTTKPGVRLMHSSVDSVPFGVFSNGVYLGKASYLDGNTFSQIGLGPNNLTITSGSRPNSILKNIVLDVQDKTEYSLFAYGTLADGSFNIKVLTEPIVRPEAGFGRVQVLNGLSDAGPISFNMEGVSKQTVSFGNTSGFFDVPEGTHNLRINNSSGGLLSSVTINVADRGELSVLVSGKLNYDFLSVKIYEDLD